MKGWQIAPMYAMDDVWFFGRALSEEEVLNLYKTNSVDGKGLTPEQSEDSEPVVDETPEAAVEIPAADAAESKPVAAPDFGYDGGIGGGRFSLRSGDYLPA